MKKTKHGYRRLFSVAIAVTVMVTSLAFPAAAANAAEPKTASADIAVEKVQELTEGASYLLLNSDQTKALSSAAGNTWGSANAAVDVTVSADETVITSDADLSTCLWVCDAEGHLCNQETVYLNLLNGGPFLKPSDSAETVWTYDAGTNLFSSGDYAVWYDSNNQYFNGVMKDNASGASYRTYLYRVTDGTDPGGHTHSYTGVVTDPTCTKGGYTTYTCSCGDTYIGNRTDALGHDWTAWKHDTSTYEYKHYRSCQRVNGNYKCDAYEEEVCEPVLVKTVPPTCGERGYSLYRCETCGYEVHTDYTDATGQHDYKTVSQAAGTGYHDLKCTICGQSIAEKCTWDAGTVIKPATDEENGTIRYTCTKCGDTRDEILPAGGGFAQDTEGNYLIQNAQDLKTLADLVNSGNSAYSKASYLMTSDIELSGEWTPIGSGTYTSDTAFAGTFDGGQHVITSLRITSVKDGNCYGLFGVTRGAVIKNLAVSGSITNRTEDTAGSRCNIGGVVGASDDSLEMENVAGHVKITNSFSYATGSAGTGTVTSHVGGLVGYAYSTKSEAVLFMKHCYADADITNENTNTNYAGYSRAYVGGLVGGSYHYFGVLNIQSSFANMDKIGVSNTILAKDDDGAVYVYGDVILGYNQGSVVQNSDIYFASGLASSVANSSMLYTVANRNTPAQGKAITASVVGSDRFKNAENGKVLFAWEADASGGSQGTVTPDTGWYNGTLDSFSLQDEADFLGLDKLVKNGETFAGKTIAIDRDIRLTDGSEFAGIGSEQHPFSGTFDGRGHIISNLAIEKETGDGYTGLFGYLDGAVVKNVTVSGTITGGDYTGGIAGRMISSTIQNCGNRASIAGIGHVGGITGAMSSNVNGDAATVQSCFNKGTVTNTKDGSAYLYTGGITGDLDPFSYVLTSYNTGRIAADNRAGTFTGGITGMCTSGTIRYCFNAGTVSGFADSTDAIAGAGNRTQCTNNLYLTDSAASGNGTPYTAAELKSSTALNALNAGTEAFQINCGSYPVLTWESVNAHLYGSWTKADALTHKRVCIRDESHVETAEHTWDDGTVLTAPTCTETGTAEYTCTACGAKKTEEIPASGHRYGKPVYSWSADKKTVTATAVCTEDAGHVLKETAKTSYRVTKKATLTAAGTGTYTVAFDRALFEPQKAVGSIAKVSLGTTKVKTANASGTKKMTVTWAKAAGATGYKVAYRKAGASKWTTKNVTGTKATLSNMKTGVLYQIKVAPIKKATASTAAVTGKYSTPVYRYYKKVSSPKYKSANKQIKVTWKRDKKASGYQISYSLKKDMTNAKTVTVKGGKKTAKTINNLKKGKKYYIRIRPYLNKGGKRYIGIWSAKKVIKVK